MVQLHILSGKKAGDQPVARRFPFRIGRAPENNLQLEDDGVWDQHLALEFQKNEGFLLTIAPEALATVNQQPVQSVLLRNGDIVALGSAKFQFWLGATRQRGLRAREVFVWLLLAAVTFGQLALVYWLSR
jgi:pSer/pThr/pTyr-binding forkhead associated (FHA) protein